ncbi:MAG: hypothetical protein ACXV3F_01850 [Frankiaceae bacterium]
MTGDTVEGRLTLLDPAPAGGLVVSTETSNIPAFPLAQLVIVPPGQTQVVFETSAGAVTRPAVVNLSATHQGQTLNATVQVLPGYRMPRRQLRRRGQRRQRRPLPLPPPRAGAGRPRPRLLGRRPGRRVRFRSPTWC